MPLVQSNYMVWTICWIMYFIHIKTVHCPKHTSDSIPSVHRNLKVLFLNVMILYSLKSAVFTLVTYMVEEGELDTQELYIHRRLLLPVWVLCVCVCARACACVCECDHWLNLNFNGKYCVRTICEFRYVIIPKCWGECFKLTVNVNIVLLNVHLNILS